MTYEIQDCVLTDRFTAVCRGELPIGDLRAWLAGSFHAVEEYLSGTATAVAGPPFARLGAHRYASAGPHWEIYHDDPDTEPYTGHWRTDVIQPYRTTPRT
jgi:hypothetical protein